MLFLFRKLRQKLVTTNSRIVTYLLYAIGEIILVVVGILIALSLDARKEQEDNRVKIDAILRGIQEDLEKDITNARYIYDDFLFVDSIQDLILNDQYTVEDYMDYSAVELGGSYVDFIINSNSYELLMNHLDIMPEAYKPLLPDLNQLYVLHQNYLTKQTERLHQTVMKFQDFRFNQVWARDYLLRIPNQQAADYYLSDPHYKGNVLTYMNDKTFIVVLSNRHRIDAMNTYQKISALLNESNPIPASISHINPDSLAENQLTGIYSQVESVGRRWPGNVEITRSGNHLHNHATGLGKNQLYWHKGSIYFMYNHPIIHRFQADTLIFDHNIFGKSVLVKK